MIVKAFAIPGKALSPGDRLAIDMGGFVREALLGEYWVGTVPESQELDGLGLPELPVGETYLTPRTSWVLVDPKGEED